MDGTEIFNFTDELVPDLIDLFIFHQANKYILDFLRIRTNIPEEKYYYFMGKAGNTVSSTIPIALKEATLEGKISKGNEVLIAGFGVGYSWGATILKF